MLTPILDFSLDLEVLLKKLDTMRCPSFSTLLPLLFNFANFALCITLTLHDTILHFAFPTLNAVYNLTLNIICALTLPRLMFCVLHDLYGNLCPLHQLGLICANQHHRLTNKDTAYGFIRTSLMQIVQCYFITLFALHVSDVMYIHPQERHIMYMQMIQVSARVS